MTKKLFGPVGAGGYERSYTVNEIFVSSGIVCVQLLCPAIGKKKTLL